jgi:hypothetical protein
MLELNTCGFVAEWRPADAADARELWIAPRIGRSEVGATLGSAW